LSITTADGSHTNTSIFYLPASITSFTPTNSAPGTRIKVTGLNFTGATNVLFNGADAAGFTVTNNTTLGATVPAGVITGPLTVLTPAGVTNSAGLFYGAPSISQFSPASGLPGTNVVLVGTNFLGATAVRFNGLNAAFTVVNNGQINATVPTGAQNGPITVVAPAGSVTSAASFVLNFTSDLAVWITNSPATITLGSNLVYTVTVVNYGPFDAPNVTLTNSLPASVRLVSATMNVPWTLNTNGNTLLASIANFGAGQSGTLKVTVVPQAVGNIIDAVSVASDNTDPSSGNDSYSITNTVLPLAYLTIGTQADQVKIAWPVSLTNYVLESKFALPGGAWVTATNVPAIVGGARVVTETTPQGTKFFRLRN
jgi:uncharacterized repeat protein (TIGR01451 family)